MICVCVCVCIERERERESCPRWDEKNRNGESKCLSEWFNIQLPRLLEGGLQSDELKDSWEDIIYKTNRDILYNSLKEIGFESIKPEGAFYLFLKSPIKDEKEFCEIAKKYNILMVPGSSFAYPGYVRISYCVSTEMIKKSISKFEELYKEIRK